MRMKAARSEDRIPISADSIDIAKDVLDIFTSGMYVSPISVYREYLQNAADAIDAARQTGLLSFETEGQVTIELDHSSRSAMIRDNGTGIKAHEAVRRLLAIGGSAKRGTQARGFRGIGRLAGLAYCRSLEFRTKAAGESIVTSVIWDCQVMRQRLSDRTFSGDLKDVICDAVTVEIHSTAGRKEQHFFEVHLHEIVRLRNDILLNEDIVYHYLSQIGPVPFSKDFSFAAEIEERLGRYPIPRPTRLSVAGKGVLKPYRDKTLPTATQDPIHIGEVEFLEFADVDGDIGAVGWVAHHQYSRAIPGLPGVRGIRARVGDLQIGEETIFADSFKESRFNAWCIGEIHVLDRRLVPNARRDNFEANHHYYNLLAQIGPVAAKLSHRCRQASVSRNTLQSVRNTIAEVSATIEQERVNPTALSQLETSLSRARTKLPRISDPELRGRLVLELDILESSLPSSHTSQDVIPISEALALVDRLITNKYQAKRLTAALQRLIS